MGEGGGGGSGGGGADRGGLTSANKFCPVARGGHRTRKARNERGLNITKTEGDGGGGLRLRGRQGARRWWRGAVDDDYGSAVYRCSRSRFSCFFWAAALLLSSLLLSVAPREEEVVKENNDDNVVVTRSNGRRR